MSWQFYNPSLLSAAVTIVLLQPISALLSLVRHALQEQLILRTHNCFLTQLMVVFSLLRIRFARIRSTLRMRKLQILRDSLLLLRVMHLFRRVSLTRLMHSIIDCLTALYLQLLFMVEHLSLHATMAVLAVHNKAR